MINFFRLLIGLKIIMRNIYCGMVLKRLQILQVHLWVLFPGILYSLRLLIVIFSMKLCMLIAMVLLLVVLFLILIINFYKGNIMRHKMSKKASKKAFRRGANNVKKINTAPYPMRGGIRL